MKFYILEVIKKKSRFKNIFLAVKDNSIFFKFQLTEKYL